MDTAVTEEVLEREFIIFDMSVTPDHIQRETFENLLIWSNVTGWRITLLQTARKILKSAVNAPRMAALE